MVLHFHCCSVKCECMQKKTVIEKKKMNSLLTLMTTFITFNKTLLLKYTVILLKQQKRNLQKIKDFVYRICL